MSPADTRVEAFPITRGGPGLAYSLGWLKKGAIAVTDQGLTAGSNFVLGIFLARWLTPEQYGAYALAFSIYLLLSAFHQALVLEPLSVLGPSLYHDHRKRYLGMTLWLQAAASVVLAVVLAAASALSAWLAHPDLASSLWGLTIGAPFILLLSLARTGCYTELAPGKAAAGAVLYCAIMLASLWAAYRAGHASPFSVFVFMGVAAGASGAVLFAQLRPDWRLGSGKPSLREVWREHWSYGRWALGSSLVNWVPSNIFYSMTGAILGMRDAGAFRALWNLSLPVAHSANAISLLLLPYLSRICGREGAMATKGSVRRMTLLYAAGAILYGALFVLGRDRIFLLLYKGKYMEYAHLVPWVMLVVVFQVASYGPCVGLRAIQSPASVFRAYAISAAVSLFVGIPATWALGLSGVMATIALSTLACLLAAAQLYRRRLAEV